jgi:hypothetical protein
VPSGGRLFTRYFLLPGISCFPVFLSSHRDNDPHGSVSLLSVPDRSFACFCSGVALPGPKTSSSWVLRQELDVLQRMVPRPPFRPGERWGTPSSSACARSENVCRPSSRPTRSVAGVVTWPAPTAPGNRGGTEERISRAPSEQSLGALLKWPLTWIVLSSGRRDSNPRPSPWQGDSFRPGGPVQSPGLRFHPSSFHGVRLNLALL